MSLMAMVFAWEGGTSIGAVQLDAVTQESNVLRSTATQYAVEDGSKVSDHVSQSPETLSLDGQVTAAAMSLFGASAAGNAARRWLTGATAAAAGAGRPKLVAAKAALRQIYEQRLPITIVTGLEVYTDMVMDSCTIKRSSASGERLDINASFTKIKMVKLREAEIPPETSTTDKAGQTRSNAGLANGRTVTADKSGAVSKLLGGQP